MRSVLQDWVMELSLREQGTLLGALRGCDSAPKNHTSKIFVRYYRFCILNPADIREVEIAGGYMFNKPPEIYPKLSHWDEFPVHWVLHMLHGIEVIAYKHPSDIIRDYYKILYESICHSMHLNKEYQSQYESRMNEDRVKLGTVAI